MLKRLHILIAFLLELARICSLGDSEYSFTFTVNQALDAAVGDLATDHNGQVLQWCKQYTIQNTMANY